VVQREVDEEATAAAGPSSDAPGSSPARSGTGKTKYILDASWCFNLLNSFDLVRICFNSTLRYKEPEKLAGRNAKHTLLRIEL
jgi:hypothetical protein